jgi:hypothetical protein
LLLHNEFHATQQNFRPRTNSAEHKQLSAAQATLLMSMVRDEAIITNLRG